jgi:hypothetical protein
MMAMPEADLQRRMGWESQGVRDPDTEEIVKFAIEAARTFCMADKQ